MIAAVVFSALILAAAVFAGVTLVGHHDRPAPTAPAVTAHTFSGTYRADYGPGTDLEGKPATGAPPMTGTWDVRSTCGAAGCIATASYTGGSGIVLVSNLVFDEVGANWVAVGLGSTSCNDAPTEVWVVFTLQPQPDGTLTGETTRSTINSCSAAKRTVTFTRTGDPDLARVPTRRPCRRGRHHRRPRCTVATTKRSPTRTAAPRRGRTISRSAPCACAPANGA